MTKYLIAILCAFLIATCVMLKLSWSTNNTLKAEKLNLQTELAGVKTDLSLSVDNANRMLSEKNRLLVMNRAQAEANQNDAVAAAKIQKDIEHAQDSHECVKSEPVQRLLRGLRDGQAKPAAGGSDPAIQEPGRTGNTVDLPAAPGRAKP